MNINDLISSIQTFIPEFNTSYCVINGALMRLDEIENMGYREFWMRSKWNMPKKLYKYFPNIKNNDGEQINYSHLALENNTVFMQSPSKFDDVYDSDIHIEYEEYEKYRLREYCYRSQLNIGSEATSEELGDCFLRWIFDTYQRTHSFDDFFQIVICQILARTKFLHNEEGGLVTIRRILQNAFQCFPIICVLFQPFFIQLFKQRSTFQREEKKLSRGQQRE